MSKLTPEQRELAERHVSLARALARRFWWRDDALSDAYWGLVQAARHYDPRRGVSFVTFAYRRIIGALRDGERANDASRRRDGTRRYWPTAWHEQLSSSDEDQYTYEEVVRDLRPSAEEAHIERDSRRELEAVISELPARTSMMVHQFAHGQGKRRIAAIHGVTPGRVSQIFGHEVRPALRALRDRAA